MLCDRILSSLSAFRRRFIYSVVASFHLERSKALHALSILVWKNTTSGWRCFSFSSNWYRIDTVRRDCQHWLRLTRLTSVTRAAGSVGGTAGYPTSTDSSHPCASLCLLLGETRGATIGAGARVYDASLILTECSRECHVPSGPCLPLPVQCFYLFPFFSPLFLFLRLPEPESCCYGTYDAPSSWRVLKLSTDTVERTRR